MHVSCALNRNMVLAERCALLSAEILKSQGKYSEAATLLIKMTSEVSKFPPFSVMSHTWICPWCAAIWTPLFPRVVVIVLKKDINLSNYLRYGFFRILVPCKSWEKGRPWTPWSCSELQFWHSNILVHFSVPLYCSLPNNSYNNDHNRW